MSDEDATAIASAGWDLIPEADAGKATAVKKAPVKAKAPAKVHVKAKAPTKARVKARDW